MHPGDDPRIAARFLAWLRERGQHSETTAGDVGRLNELGAWTLPSADVARPEMPEDERARLLALHVAWRQFCSQQDADWVGKADTSDGDVTWIDAAGEPDRKPPTGRAPRLLPPGVQARRVSGGSPFRGVGGALVVPATFALAVLGLYLAESLSEASLVRSIREASAVVEGGLDESRARVARQRALAGTLASLRRKQRDLVNARCEAGPWCDARVEARQRSLRLAEQFAANAASWPVGDDLPRESGSALLPRDIEDLRAEREAFARGWTPDSSERPFPTAAELARRRALVEAELALVEAVRP